MNEYEYIWIGTLTYIDTWPAVLQNTYNSQHHNKNNLFYFKKIYVKFCSYTYILLVTKYGIYDFKTMLAKLIFLFWRFLTVRWPRWGQYWLQNATNATLNS